MVLSMGFRKRWPTGGWRICVMWSTGLRAGSRMQRDRRTVGDEPVVDHRRRCHIRLPEYRNDHVRRLADFLWFFLIFFYQNRLSRKVLLNIISARNDFFFIFKLWRFPFYNQDHNCFTMFTCYFFIDEKSNWLPRFITLWFCNVPFFIFIWSWIHF